MRSQSASRSTLPTITGRGAQTRAELGALAPDDGLVGVGIEALLEREAEALCLARDEIALVPSALEVRRERRERAAQAARRGDRQRGEVGGAHAPARFRTRRAPRRARLRGAPCRRDPRSAACVRRARTPARSRARAGSGRRRRCARRATRPRRPRARAPRRRRRRRARAAPRCVRRTRSADRGRRSTARGSRTRSRHRRRAPGPVRSSRWRRTGQRPPRQRSAPTVSCDQSPGGGATSSSARSPVSVLASHGRRRSSAAGWSGSISRCSTSFAASRQM